MTQSTDTTLERVPMTPLELRASASLGLIFFLRMLGLFLVLPVLAVESSHLAGATPLLTGLAVGAYGLTQALLQVPMGALSDRIGRKPVIAAGLVVFALGSALAALSHSIHGVIAGRCLQGAGAIAAAVLALSADLTAEQQRVKAMAFIGIGIGIAFSLAFVAGPVIAAHFGLSGVFWSAAALAAMALAVLLALVPSPPDHAFHAEVETDPRLLSRVLASPLLRGLDLGVLVLHLVMTATFVALPVELVRAAGLPTGHHWWVYLPALVVSMAVLAPVLRRGRGAQPYPLLLRAMLGLAVSLAAFAVVPARALPIAVVLSAYFVAFNLLEASLPALVASHAPPGTRGTAMGVYSTSQFLGAFLGGAGGGWLLGHFGPTGVFLACAALTGAWYVLARAQAAAFVGGGAAAGAL